MTGRLIDADELERYIDNCEFCNRCPDASPRCQIDCEMPDFLTKRWKRVIDAQPTVDAQSEIDRLKRLGFSMMDTIMGMMEMVNNTEPVRHGNWKPFDEDEYTCSVCGNIFVTMDGEHPLSNEFKYCPFCGAKMDAHEKEDDRKID